MRRTYGLSPANLDNSEIHRHRATLIPLEKSIDFAENCGRGLILRRNTGVIKNGLAHSKKLLSFTL